MFDLRQYQTEVIDAICESRGRLLIVAPTGAGKTVIAGELIRRANCPTVFLAHRRELVFQAVGKLNEFGIEAGVVLAGEEANPSARVQIASTQTLWTRAMVRKTTALPPARLLIIDEAHHCRAETYQKLMAAYPKAFVVGLTATPCRGDGKGLGNVFGVLIECPQVPSLIEQGYLVGTQVYAPSTPDLKGVKVRQGDYAKEELAARVDQPKLVGDIVEHWLRLAGNRRTIVFATGVAHSKHIRDEFRKAGVRAEHIDATTPKADRDGILALLARGDISVVCNCSILTEGFDLPDIGCIVLARPTKSMGLYRQMVGRGLRPAGNKNHLLVLDHAGATFQHGFVEDPVRWTLSVDERPEAPANRKRRLLTCSNCRAVRVSGKPCKVCGFEPPQPPVHVHDGGLTHLSHNGRDPEYEYDFLAMATHVQRERDYKPGWVNCKFKERFGHWPQFSAVPMEPSAEFLEWERQARADYIRKLRAANG